MMKQVSEYILLFLLIVGLVPIIKSSSSLNSSLNDDVLGLIVFKADIKDPNGKLSSWNEDDNDSCKWYGVKCNPRSNRVSELNLDGLSLSGKLGRGLLQLQSLRKLSLSNNNLTGSLSSALVRLTNLRILDLSDNNFSGLMSSDFFRQCGPLRSINLANNKFSGEIPDSLSSCVGLTVLNLSANQFSGSLPSGIWGLHGLRSLDLSSNLLMDEIPKGMDGLYNLRTINLSRNRLTGPIPNEVGGCSLLKSIDFSGNSLSGSLPITLLNLSFIGYLNVGENSFVGRVPEWIGEMKGLENLDLSANNFSGVLPTSVGKLRSLKVFNMSMNALSGSLPESMAGCLSLQVIDFRLNMLTGDLPQWMFKVALQEILLSENKIGGTLDDSLSTAEEVSYRSLEALDLSRNVLTGAIPSSLGKFSNLEYLNLSQNTLTGPIPRNVGELKALNVLDLSHNRMNGSIPSEIGNATSLQELILEKNFIEGIIPTSLEHCSSLSVLMLSHNSLEGPVPLALSKLVHLQIVDLSVNDLSGTMPKQLANLQHLRSFNISHNNLQGELPGGFFNTISPSSVSDNPSLCGSAAKRSCATVLPKPIVLNPNSTADASSGSSLPPTFVHKKNLLSISSLIAIGAAAVIVIGVIAITVLNLRVRASASRSAAALALSNGDDFSNSPSTDANSGKLVIFSGEPDFSTGTHALLNKDCELGRGGFGAVYQTVLQNGRSVAIKKLTVSSLVKSQEDFEREVKKLGKIRHSNLVTLEGYYWTPSLQLLIYEFVSGGTLHKHLHEGGGGNFLSWNDRFNIIVGMAKGLSHLHQLNVIHYNLKSSNILIDGLGEPKVGDFGLARLLPMLDRYILSSKIQSALGYMAPEFACRTVKITEKCDVYGFGVLVLEVVTGRRPVEYMEDDVVVLCDMVRGALEEGKVEECVDERLQGRFPAEEAIPVMKLGLICTSQVPSNRPDMREVVNILELIRCPSEGQEESA
ncbi:probable LRR receptor-like serine/threonine-protein kinase IRK [Beta vulgaris subsp. vulgaris]|uniref:probable LRR receptor-like serine/threonine-protein kinase IRK n=1 Tax=Beta vulgaris subsp. vulgaris TaxID=3555 RepID=UPI0020372986|nr:probable LRR receptor-like serine/threonine-protein kinase IRK [Beta vulgaris subsp. vulgaris]